MAAVWMLALTVVYLSGCQAEVNVTEYVLWKKAHISGWHEFFPMRSLEEEWKTTVEAAETVQSLRQDIFASLSGIVAFQGQELAIALQKVAGTNAQSCVEDIAEYLPNTIDNEVSTFNDCTSEAISELSRLYTIWTKKESKYLAAYQKALNDIEECSKSYHSSDSLDKLRSCVTSVFETYSEVAFTTNRYLFYSSPTMTYFQDEVIDCASESALVVASKGKEFLQMLIGCVALAGNEDITIYAMKLNQWKGYKDTLTSQISEAQNKYSDLVVQIELELHKYHKMIEETMEEYVFQIRGLPYYQNEVHMYLNKYYDNITATSAGIPGDSRCINDAWAAVDAVVNTAAHDSVQCYLENVNSVKSTIEQIYVSFMSLMRLIPSFGNAALVNCFSEGFMFAPNIIRDCYNLAYTKFNIEYTEHREAIVKDVKTLSEYETSFFRRILDLPCGDTSLKRAFLGCDKGLLNMQRCLYKSGITLQ